MKRILTGLAFAAALGVGLAACDDSSGTYADYLPPSAGSGACSAYTTCGACTPVQGCGWCFDAHGGTCASSPDECANSQEFTWTWDPSGCPDVDASVLPVADAGSHPDAPPTDSGALPDGQPIGNDAGDAAQPGDAAGGPSTDATSD